MNILVDLRAQLAQAHFGIADISNNNRNVLYEAGLIHGIGTPLILLYKKHDAGGGSRKRSGEAVPFDIFSDFRVEYQVSKRGSDIKFFWLEEELNKAMEAVFKMRSELAMAPAYAE